MDQKSEIKKLRLILIVGATVLITGCHSWTELKYSLRGKTADAVVMRAQPFTEYGRHETTYQDIDYLFREDDGKVRQESDRLAEDFQAPPMGTHIKVQYLAGVENASRLEGHRKMGSVYVFLACSAVLLFLFGRLWYIGQYG